MIRLWLVAMLLLPVLATAQTGQLEPLGHWRTFDDLTGLERGVVAISAKDGLLNGVIVSTIDPEEGRHVCEKCVGEQHNQPILGLKILHGLRQDGDEWTGGRILDPETGVVYRCKVHMEDNGRKLVLRGYLGISLLGRSQTWLRADP